MAAPLPTQVQSRLLFGLKSTQVFGCLMHEAPAGFFSPGYEIFLVGGQYQFIYYNTDKSISRKL